MIKQQQKESDDLVFIFGHDELIIHKRYEVLSIINDLMLALWFAIGSVCFFYQGEIETIGVWLFLIGSVQLMIRPIIRLTRSVHLKRLPEDIDRYE